MVTEAAARRELEDLRAAINYHRRETLGEPGKRWVRARLIDMSASTSRDLSLLVTARDMPRSVRRQSLPP
jgi:hypothetical protein